MEQDTTLLSRRKHMKTADVEIVKFKLTNTNKKGKKMQHIKLLGLDKNNRKYYIKFVSTEFADDLVFHSAPGEVIDEVEIGCIPNPWMQ